VDGGEKQSLLRFDVNGSITNRATATGQFGATTVTSNQEQATINQVPPTAKLTRTNVACNAFANGTATDLAELQYAYIGPKITGVAPSSLFYYSKVTAPASSFTLQVEQSKLRLETLPPAIGDVILYATCAESTPERRPTTRRTGRPPSRWWLTPASILYRDQVQR
jgi:hypothetical protein